MQQAHTLFQAGVGCRYQNDGGVDRNARQRHHPVQGKQAQGIPGHQQPQRDAGKCQRHRGNHQEGLKVAAELRSQNYINGAQAKHQQQSDGIQTFGDIIQFAGKIDRDIRVTGLYFAPFIPDQAVCLQGIDFVRIDIAFQGNRPAEIVVENVLCASPRRTHDQFFQRNGPAVRQ